MLVRRASVGAPVLAPCVETPAEIRVVIAILSARRITSSLSWVMSAMALCSTLSSRRNARR
jgi:hypothetical protein